MTTTNKSRVYVSTTCFMHDIFGEQGLVVPTQIRGIELSGGNGFYDDETLHTVLDRLGEKEGRELRIHNYFPVPEQSFVLNFASSDPVIVERSLSLADKALHLCSVYGIPYYSFHPGYLSDGREMPNGHFEFPTESFRSYGQTLAAFAANFETLYTRAVKAGVRLAVENLFIAPGNLATSLNCSFEELDEMMDLLPEDVGIVLDLGHLNVSAHYLGFERRSYIDSILNLYSDRIFELHLSANDGIFDQHLPLADDDWQLHVLKEFGLCPGVDGRGVCVVMEARALSPWKMNDTLELIEKYI